MDGTNILQGRFTSDGAAKLIELRTDVDWMEVTNATQWATTQSTGRGVKFYWQRGLAAGAAFETTKEDSGDDLQGEFVTSGGFTLLDPNAGPEAAVTGTTITKADPPVCTTSSPHGYSNGDVVLIYGGDLLTQIDGVYFTIGEVTSTTFELSYFDSNIGNFTANTSYMVRRIPNPNAFLPGGAVISAVTTGATTAVQLTMDGLDLQVGDLMRFTVPDAFGMSELDGLAGEILSINTTTNTYTVDIDSQTFTAFGWPATSAFPSTFPEAVAFGNKATAPHGFVNVKKLYMRLGAGIDGPAGSSSDVIYWRAGKSLSVDNS